MASIHTFQPHEPWNKGKLLIVQKTPLKLKDIWAIRIRLQLDQEVRYLALFNLAFDSKLRACRTAEGFVDGRDSSTAGCGEGVSCPPVSEVYQSTAIAF